jgi:ATP-dependent Clp protease ATP-binding subunit ClpC
MVGFNTGEGIMDRKEIKASAMTELKRFFRPEFLNRIDEIVVFDSLSKDDINRILNIQLSEVQTRLAEKEIILEVKKKTREYLVEKGFDPKFGARPLRRVIQKEIEDPLSMEILKGRFWNGSHVMVNIRNGKISFREKKGSSKKKEPALIN